MLHYFFKKIIDSSLLTQKLFKITLRNTHASVKKIDVLQGGSIGITMCRAWAFLGGKLKSDTSLNLVRLRQPFTSIEKFKQLTIFLKLYYWSKYVKQQELCQVSATAPKFMGSFSGAFATSILFGGFKAFSFKA